MRLNFTNIFAFMARKKSIIDGIRLKRYRIWFSAFARSTHINTWLRFVSEINKAFIGYLAFDLPVLNTITKLSGKVNNIFERPLE